MAMNDFPLWLNTLEPEDFEFIRQFILSSGSLKEMEKRYNVSYPTIRLRLDRLIQKVADFKSDTDSYVNYIKDLALEGEMSYQTAKKLIVAYKRERSGSQ